ncbi:MAG TPA: DNA topoisomerase I [Steroidobacteraceae bacterium]|nr:DNA topoisomerase I [Steroidobacteraceae bacterium]
MPENLLIVESPAKAKTLKKYLGKDFEVLASYGHVRDLIPKEGAVDPDRGFSMQYQVLEKNERHVEAISRSLRKSKALYLATDPDREGEAIAWHLKEILQSRGELDGKRVHRVAFYEITRNAIRAAVGEPRDLSLDLVNAQQARRALDYLVGFNLSPLLWKKVRRGLSAGRVQSPALRMICEREAQIAAFIAQEYWTIEGEGSHTGQAFPLKLLEYSGRKVEQFSFVNEAQAREVERTIEAAARSTAQAAAPGLGELRIIAIDRKQRRRNPAPPFTTSTLQQEAARKLGFNARRTMRLAQQLYEGIDIGDGSGSVGLISYMRTDSVTLAAEAITEIREVAAREYGKAEVAEEPRIYKTKSKNAQEAHEAIRPTSASILPGPLEGKIDPDLYKLYSLIWKRAVASQMSHAIFDTVAVDMLAGKDGPERHLLRANGSTLVKPGYIAVYQEGTDDSRVDDTDHALPPMEVGDIVTLAALRAEQHFTEPPPRYSEASLVKALEEHGIGRPSTYATIISTLQDREYVEMDARRFVPTDIGKIVNRFLTDHFHHYVEYGFTAAMEDELDAVSRGEEDWTTPLGKFWKPFIIQVQKIEKNVTREQVAQARELGKDPASGKPMTVRMGRYGPFVQIGTKDDEEKPRFAGLRPGQKMDTLTLADALELFKLPRTLGATADGEPIITNVGRFGPYVKYGSKYVSLKEDDPYTVSLERALEVIRLKQEADANRIIADFSAEGIQVLNGRYGPYVTDGTKNAKIPKDRDPKSLTPADCRELLAQAPARGGRFGRGRRGTQSRPRAGNGQGTGNGSESQPSPTPSDSRPKRPRASTAQSAATGTDKQQKASNRDRSRTTPEAADRKSGTGKGAAGSLAGARSAVTAKLGAAAKAGAKPGPAAKNTAAHARAPGSNPRVGRGSPANKPARQSPAGKPPAARKNGKSAANRPRGLK